MRRTINIPNLVWTTELCTSDVVTFQLSHSSSKRIRNKDVFLTDYTLKKDKEYASPKIMNTSVQLTEKNWEY